jgi:AcrR family transcriptional regulator
VTAPKRQRRGAPVVERVLALTLEELARVGYQRLSVPEIAARAGLNKTSVYRRWPTRRALVGAALASAMGHDAPPPDTGALRSDMREMVLGAAAWAESPVGRGVLRVLLQDADDPEVRELAPDLERMQAAAPAAIFARAVERGELSADADVPMALGVIAGAITHRIFVEHAPITPAFAERLVRLVADGLARG